MSKILTLYIEIFMKVSAVEVCDLGHKWKKFVSDFIDIMLYLSEMKYNYNYMLGFALWQILLELLHNK